MSKLKIKFSTITGKNLQRAHTTQHRGRTKKNLSCFLYFFCRRKVTIDCQKVRTAEKEDRK